MKVPPWTLLQVLLLLLLPPLLWRQLHLVVQDLALLFLKVDSHLLLLLELQIGLLLLHYSLLIPCFPSLDDLSCLLALLLFFHFLVFPVSRFLPLLQSELEELLYLIFLLLLLLFLLLFLVFLILLCIFLDFFLLGLCIRTNLLLHAHLCFRKVRSHNLCKNFFYFLHLLLNLFFLSIVCINRGFLRFHCSNFLSFHR